MASTSMARTPVAHGQLLITGFRGTKSGDIEVEHVCRMLETGRCAGVILLRRNCISQEQISLLSRTFRDAAGDATPIISVDQEGGRVARLDATNGFEDWMSAQEIAQSGLTDSDMEVYWTKRAWQLFEVGINLNFAPVVDLNRNPRNPIIGSLGRSFGSDAGQVTNMAKLFIRAHKSAGVKTSLKHFPGHGSSTTDSHKGAADVSQSWSQDEMEPFIDLINGGFADSIMTGHLLHPNFSDEPWIPASLSHRADGVIRGPLGFKGAIFTDDMQMTAVEGLMSLAEAAVAAVNVGNTFLIYSNYRKSDRIDTLDRVIDALDVNVNRMDPTMVEKQIALGSKFRSDLR